MAVPLPSASWASSGTAGETRRSGCTATRPGAASVRRTARPRCGSHRDATARCWPRRGARAPPGRSTGSPRCSAPTTTRPASAPTSTPWSREAHRRRPHVRFGASHRVFETLVPAVIEQKVTGQEAFAGFRRLVHRFGERAPGTGQRAPALGAAERHHRPPDPVLGVAQAPHRPRPLRTLVRAATVADTLDRLTAADADAKLRTLPGIGEWTSAEVRSRAFGDADAVSFGDYHVAKDVGWAVTGTPYDDEELRGVPRALAPPAQPRGRAHPRTRRRASAARPAHGTAHPPARALACRAPLGSLPSTRERHVHVPTTAPTPTSGPASRPFSRAPRPRRPRPVSRRPWSTTAT